MLSGFLITTLLLEERVATGTISFARFYRRRAARLVPGLVLMLAVYAIVTRGAHAQALLFGLTYTSNIATVIDAGAMPWSLGHLWSLAQEEQFYLLWPPLLLLLTRARASLLPKALALLLLAAILERLSLVAHGSDIQRIYFAPDTHAEPILVGCLFGALQSRWAPPAIRSWGGPGALAIVVGSVLASQWVWIFSPLSPIRTVFFFACGFLILAAAQGDTLGARARKSCAHLSRTNFVLALPVARASTRRCRSGRVRPQILAIRCGHRGGHWDRNGGVLLRRAAAEEAVAPSQGSYRGTAASACFPDSCLASANRLVVLLLGAGVSSSGL